MLKLLIGCALSLPLTLLVACEATMPGLGGEAGSTRLPSGLTLLDSGEGDCDGTVQVAEGTIEDEGEGLEGEFLVEAGQNATFELEAGEEEIEWACMEGGSPGVDTVRCPSGTTHVRVTRAAEGGELLFECYG